MLHPKAKSFVTLVCLTVLVYCSVSAQSSVLTSLNPEFTTLINDGSLTTFGPGFTVERESPGYAFGVTLRQRRFSRKGSSFSFEYGISAQRVTTRLTFRQLSGELADVSLRSTQLSLPLTLFFDGFKPANRLYRSQSGLFASLRTGLQFRGQDLAANTYGSHLLLGARTRGKVLYFQLSYGWSLWTTDSRFTAFGKAFALREPARRFTFLSVGYTFRN